MKRNIFLREYDAMHPIYCHYTRRNNVNYFGQKSMAKKRHIKWDFTFYEWIEWWVNTGHFHERGVKNNQYQMCRYNDVGDYSITNVYCDTGSNNKKKQLNKKSCIFLNVEYKSISDAIKASGLSRPEFYRKHIHGVNNE